MNHPTLKQVSNLESVAGIIYIPARLTDKEMTCGLLLWNYRTLGFRLRGATIAMTLPVPFMELVLVVCIM
jgi:hypothetical protein